MNRLMLVVLLVVVAAGAFWGGRRMSPVAEQVAPAPVASDGRKILYYRNPMGQPDTSPVPKKDPMGMDYIPVYEGGEPEEEGVLKISLARLQKLGVQTAAVERRVLAQPLRAVGSLVVNERGLHTVTARFSGWVESLRVNTTGQAVQKGERVMAVYSPELLAAQQELHLALEGEKMLAKADADTRRRAAALVEASRQRLDLWAISAEQLREAEAGRFTRQLWLHAPASGVVLEKPAVEGRRFMAGEPLLQVADLSALWLIAEVFEQDMGRVRVGQSAQFTVDAFPGEVFKGRVDFISPTANLQTRTAQVRIELANPVGRLRPAMFGQVEVRTGKAQPVLAVEDSAVLDSGLAQTVLVDLGGGRFEPRTVETGARAEGWVEIRKGIKAGERVVTRANFLIDSESNLKAALAGIASHEAGVSKSQHEGEAKVVAVDVAAATVTLAHQPIASLKWPAMTMDFVLGDAALARQLRPGAKVHFWFEERGEGEWTITRVKGG
jgi:Cu(I)/Ag(I) efflux system membrane fusion protein